MCCISKPIINVAGTKLFCGVNKEKTRQFTVYSNTVENVSNNNAMVLPVPYPDSVKFHNLEAYKNFFKDCQKCFVTQQSQDFGLTNSYSLKSFEGKKKLDVVNVGSFQVSLAKSLKELKLVDTNVFELSEGLENALTKHYSNSMFGFIICKLAKGKENYHPFAYSHNMLNNKVFIPTRHYHDENKSHSTNMGNDFFKSVKFTSDNIDNSPMFNTMASSLDKVYDKIDDRFADDWDHDIYLYNVNANNNLEVKRMSKCIETWNGEVNIDFDKINFALNKDCGTFQKLKINGVHPNMDIILEAY